jgi:hypothetical protein
MLFYIFEVVEILHGRGHQFKLTQSYQDLREKGLLDINKLSYKEQILVDLKFPDGGGSTDLEKIYIFDNIPIPADRSTTKVDRREVPTYGLGEGED